MIQINRITLLCTCFLTTVFLTADRALIAHSQNNYPPKDKSSEQHQNQNIVERIDRVAQNITVKIVSKENGSFASGVLIARQDNTYYVLTGSDALDKTDSYEIITPDYLAHTIDNRQIERAEAASEVAIATFESDNDYQVATLADYQWGEQWIFTSGFVKDGSSKSQSDRILTGGRLFTAEQAPFVVKDASSLTGENDLVYTNDSDRGTGGGAILDSKGRLIGIHSGSESELYINEDGNFQPILLGYSIGVSVRNLLTLIESEQIKLESKLLNIESDLPNITKAQIKDIQQQTQVEIAPAANSNPREYLNYGNQLWRYQKYDLAIAALETAVELDPGFDRAYYSLGLAAKDSGNYQQAVTAFKKATELNDSVGYYWRNLGLVYSLLQQYDRALEAYDRAIALNTSQQQPNSILNIERDRILERIDNK